MILQGEETSVSYLKEQAKGIRGPICNAISISYSV